MEEGSYFKCEHSTLEFYKCQNCNFKTNIGISFFHHFQKFHAENKKIPSAVTAACYSCEYCDFSTFSLLLLFKHNLTCEENFKKEKEVDKLQCSYCIFKAAKRTSLKEHVIRKHTPLEKIKWHNCSQCDYKAKIRSDLRLHVKYQHKTDILRYYCNHCDYKSKKKHDLNRHILAKHTELESKLKYKCNKCEFKTLYHQNLKSHIIQHRTTPEGTAIQWYQCEHCNYRSKIKHYLTRHMRRHVKVYHKSEENKGEIIANDTELENISKLKSHIIEHPTEPEETGIQWYQCNHCGYKSKRKSDVTLHIKTQHMSAEKKKKLFNCNHCEYKSRNIGHLKEHILAKHTPRENVPKYECNICCYKTIRKGDLKSHILRIHTDRDKIDWHRCPHCDYKSVFKGDLTSHNKLKHLKVKELIVEKTKRVVQGASSH